MSNHHSIPRTFGKDFIKSDLKTFKDLYNSTSPDILLEYGVERAIKLFHAASEKVPAYKDFLKKNNINPKKIKTYSDFQQVPIVDKKNYLRAYPLKDLCWNGTFDNLYILSSSSGSTGEPFLWPRGENQELEGALTFELIFRDYFHVDKYSTLYIDCFAMGTWIAGPFVLACAEYLTRKGYPILTVTPGIDKNVIFSLFKNLSPNFDQIVISGYPPFIKDILDLGESHGIDWKKHTIKFLFAAEGFSEYWREYIHEKVGANNSLTTSINLYGSADAAILAHETPMTTAIRQAIFKYPKILFTIFSDTRMPTLTQYDPRAKFFEEVDQNIVFTTNSGIPLIRYSIGDHGGVFSYKDMVRKLETSGYDSSTVFQNIEIKNRYKLPFVYLFGRSDLTISFYGLLIYPEHIKYCLEKHSLEKFITGKFVLSLEYDDEQNPVLLIRVELSKGEKPTEILHHIVHKSVLSGLKKINSEYNRLYQAIKDKAVPSVELIENGNIEYFRPGAKQRWVKKV